MRIVPVTQARAAAFVAEHHRHHVADRGHLFCIGCEDGGRLVGVAVVGRPKARNADDGATAEVTRLCTDGTRNACSMLYGAAWRAARAMGYARLITYTLPEEGGASLRGAGWRAVARVRGGTWSRAARQRTDDHPTQMKLRWQPADCPPPPAPDRASLRLPGVAYEERGPRPAFHTDGESPAGSGGNP